MKIYKLNVAIIALVISMAALTGCQGHGDEATINKPPPVSANPTPDPVTNKAPRLPGAATMDGGSPQPKAAPTDQVFK